MSVQFGRWHFEGQPPASEFVARLDALLAPYGPDSSEMYSQGDITILYRALRTTRESHREKQPHVSHSGAVITWDGRLDNRTEIIAALGQSLTTRSTDVEIVAATFERWGERCFPWLVGDWAISIWNPKNRSLTLAKDPIGTRHLYYSINQHQVAWSTILDPLVLFGARPFAISEEYIAEWFANVFPPVHLTPFVGIHGVAPSSAVIIRQDSLSVTKYWDFDPGKRIRYNTDEDYEEHFRDVLTKAVQRRLRSDKPVLAELSGGMDSSSVVCVADAVIAADFAETRRLDTISWYDDSNPGLDERPFFTKVEEKRGRVGWHINLRNLESNDISSQASLLAECNAGAFVATPPFDSAHEGFFKHYAACMNSQGYRVTLSGIGGGDVTGGGVPTPIHELQNLIATGHFFILARQLRAWANKMKTPQASLLLLAARGFLPDALGAPSSITRSSICFDTSFIQRNSVAFRDHSVRVKFLGSLPSFQDNQKKLDGNRRFLACCNLKAEMPHEKRYPYLDRDLLEFVFAIPREQIVRVANAVPS